MVTKVKGYEIPHGNTTIWRYMGLEKFIDLLVNSKIRLTLVSLLSDDNELGLPLIQKEKRYYELFENIRSQADYINRVKGKFEVLEELRLRVKDLRDRTYLNSWSLGSHESYALWKIYLGGATTGVAIKSTVSSVCSSLEKDKDISIKVGRVNYKKDFIESEELRDEDFILTKLEYYKYEEELRFFYPSSPPLSSVVKLEQTSSVFDHFLSSLGQDSTKEVDVDLKTLIHEIYISPFMVRNFKRTLKELIEKFAPRLDVPIHHSSVKDN